MAPSARPRCRTIATLNSWWPTRSGAPITTTGRSDRVASAIRSIAARTASSTTSWWKRSCALYPTRHSSGNTTSALCSRSACSINETTWFVFSSTSATCSCGTPAATRTNPWSYSDRNSATPSAAGMALCGLDQPPQGTGAGLLDDVRGCTFEVQQLGRRPLLAVHGHPDRPRRLAVLLVRTGDAGDREREVGVEQPRGALGHGAGRGLRHDRPWRHFEQLVLDGPAVRHHRTPEPVAGPA